MPEGKMMWAYRAVFTQTNAGGGSILANFTFPERTIFYWGRVGLDNYASARSVSVTVADAVAGNIWTDWQLKSIDNQNLAFPWDDASETATGDAPRTNMFYEFGKGDTLRISASSLVQNETLTITLRALIKTTKPVIATTGSGGTVTETVTHSKVI